MKIRTDFVTNSSSSSFILGFKKEDEIAYTIWNDYQGEYMNDIVQDCMNAKKMTIEDVIELARDELEWDCHWTMETYAYRNIAKLKTMSYKEEREWFRGPEFQNLVNQEIERKLNEMREKAEKEGLEVFVEIEYEDWQYPELENYIVGNLSCCLETFDHH